MEKNKGVLNGHLLLRGLVVPLPHDKETVIGRDNEQCDVALMDERISRAHASVIFQDGRYYICDKKSTNGVFLNGEKISGKAPLVVNDVIEIGPYSAVFVGSNHPQVHKSGRDRAVAPEAVESSLFSGHLSLVSLPDVIQLLNSIQKSGVLKVNGKSNKESVIGFDEGEVTSAVHEGTTGEEAFYAILRIKSGDFKFVPGQAPTAKEPMGRNTMSLLLEGSRRIDEGEMVENQDVLNAPPPMTRKLPKLPV
ncbi:MAG: DUF4388 domain-containing protein [Spartobacteria bacterium]|nr:DUF4388 domain-containing protein [Spartobacteria bacterium]